MCEDKLNRKDDLRNLSLGSKWRIALYTLRRRFLLCADGGCTRRCLFVLPTHNFIQNDEILIDHDFMG